jgi:hypothetical protein
MWTKVIPMIVLCAASAHATDIPEGGDAVYHQLRASSDVVIADLRPSVVGYLFEAVQQLRGAAPASFYLTPDNAEERDALRAGQRYLLFLQRGRSGPELAVSYYSAIAIDPADTAAFADFIRSYVKVMSDKAALKSLLMRSAGLLLPYIPYSSVADLVGLGLLNASDVTSLAKMMDAGQVTDAKAKGILVGQIVKFRLTELVPTLQRLAVDRAQPLLVRSRSLDALYQLRATDALRSVAAQIEDDPSLHLRRKMADIGTRIR